MSLICILTAYLLGSINSAILLSKLFSLEDPRTVGSGNAGATNMLRLAGKGLASLVLGADFLKGLLAVGLANLLGVTGTALGFVALAAVIGHVLPLYTGFRGGKGVATTAGVCFGLSFYLGVILILVWMAVMLHYRYSSLAGLMAATVMPLLAGAYDGRYFLPLGMIAALIFIAHRDNIVRLMAGTEPTIDANKLEAANDEPPSSSEK